MTNADSPAMRAELLAAVDHGTLSQPMAMQLIETYLNELTMLRMLGVSTGLSLRQIQMFIDISRKTAAARRNDGQPATARCFEEMGEIFETMKQPLSLLHEALSRAGTRLGFTRAGGSQAIN